jgi:integrase/recombinase XerD
VEVAQIDLINEFKQTLYLSGMSPSAVSQYPRVVGLLYDFVGGDLLGVTEEVLVRYLADLRGKKLSQVSITRYFTILGIFYDFLVVKKYITASPITSAFRRFYLKLHGKNHDVSQRRQCITVEQAKMLVESILDPMDAAVVLLLIKTGIRRHELSELNVEDVDLENMTIHVNPTGKRSNEIVYYDLETSIVLKKWLTQREKLNKNGLPALFLGKTGNRLSPPAINLIVIKHAEVVGLHDPKSKRLDKRLTPHSLRHYFSTRLREAGMPREYVMELRGDAGADAIDTYYHIDKKKLQKSYLDCVPQFGLI